jgi:hypothetical protein
MPQPAPCWTLGWLVWRRRGGGAVLPGSHRQRVGGRGPGLHSTGSCSNAPIQAGNLLTGEVKPSVRLPQLRQLPPRRLLHCGVRWHTHHTATLRGHSPRLMAKSRVTTWLPPGRPSLRIMEVGRRQLPILTSVNAVPRSRNWWLTQPRSADVIRINRRIGRDAWVQGSHAPAKRGDR